MRSVMSFIGLWRLVYARLASEPVLTITLLFGWVAFVALMAAIPMYSDASNQQLLNRELAQQAGRGATYGFYFRYVGGSEVGASWGEYDAVRQYMAVNLPYDLGLPRRVEMHYGKSDLLAVFPAGSQYTFRELLTRGNLGFVHDVEAHIMLLEGVFPQPVQGVLDTLEVLVSQKLAQQLGLQVGEQFILFDEGRQTATGERKRIELPVQVVGVWVAKDPESEFWYISPKAFDETFLLPEANYMTLAASGLVPHALYTLGWYQAFDGSSIRAEDVLGFLKRVDKAESRIKKLSQKG